MEKETVLKPKTMQDILNDRTKIYENRINEDLICILIPTDDYLFRNNQSESLCKFIKKKDENKKFYGVDLFYNHEGYSAFGFIIIAIQNKYLLRYSSTLNSLIKRPKIQTSLKDRQKSINELLSLNYEPTEKDRELDKLDAYEQATRARLLLKHSTFLKLHPIPQDIIDYILHTMFEIKLLPIKKEIS